MQLLQNSCRLCGTTKLQKPGSKSKNDYKTELLEIFDLNIELDDERIHPNAICRTHELTILRYRTTKRQGKVNEFKTSIVPATFSNHDNNCPVCRKPKVGRKRKQPGMKKTSLSAACHPPDSASGTPQEDVEEYADASASNNSVLVDRSKDRSPKTHNETNSATLADMFKLLSSTEKAEFLDTITEVLSRDELSLLAFKIGQREQKDVLSDVQNVSTQYLNKEFLLNLDINNWVKDRNQVACKFLEGLTGFEPSFESDRIKSLAFCQALEQIYSIRMQKLVAPLSFMFALDIYSKTSSRTVIDLLCKVLPSGSYTTLTNWLAKSGNDAPPCPTGNVMLGFDNEQVIGYKRGVTPHQKSRSSVITTTVFVEMNGEDNTFIQSNEKLKPQNIFSVQHFKEKLQATKTEEEFKKLQKQREDFEHEIRTIRDQTSENYLHLEKIHYEQLYYFVENAISTVMKEQEITDKGVTDTIDKTIFNQERSMEVLVCTLCGAENARRKQICESCKQREGIQEARKAKATNVAPTSKRTSKGKIRESKTDSNLSNKDDFQRYQHVPTNHRQSTEILMGMSAFLNPNSNESVSLILRHLGMLAGIRRYKGTDRKWCFICCDGRPHSLFQKIVDEAVVCNYCNASFLNRQLYSSHHKDHHTDQQPLCTREFDWLYLRIGAGHYEMNVVKAFFELNWAPFLDKLCEVMGFTSDNAKRFAKMCKDHHVAWQLLLVFHTASLQEIVLPYVRSAIEINEQPSADGFFSYYKREMSAIPNTAYIQMQVFRFSQAIINLRMGIRRNNSDLVRSAKFHLKELFYGRSHPHYQNIELFDEIQYHFMPEQVKPLWNDNISFSVSGDASKGQDLDFLLEEKNKAVKQYLPSGTIPSDDTWKTVCCNIKYFENLNEKLLSLLGIVSSKDYGTKILDISAAVEEFRPVLRRYLRNREKTLTSITGQPLHEGLLRFIEKANANRCQHINTSVLAAGDSDIVNEPVYVTEEEETNQKSKLSKADLVKYIQKMICQLSDDALLQRHYTEVLKSVDHPKVKKGTYLTLYYELKDIIADLNSEVHEESDM